MPSNKEIAVSFLNDVISGKIAEAYAAYVHPSMKHHNAYFAGDPLSLMTAMQENHKLHPLKTFSIKHVVVDGDFVVVHSHLQMSVSEPGMVVVYMFRFTAGKIVEMWDVGQVILKDSPNENGMF